MYCENCGHPIPDGARFCDNCGTPLIPAGAAHPEEIYENTSDDTMIPPMPEAPDASSDASGKRKQKKKMKQKAGGPEPDVKIEGRRVTENICLCPDGKYRWIYEMPILKNPTIFILVWKILFFIILGIFVFINILDAIEWGSDFAGRLPGNLLFFACFVAGMTVILVISMLIYAAIMGGKYVVMFEMDEKGVEHKQLPKQVKKAQAIALVTALAGIATHNVDRAKTRKIR